MDKPKVVVVDKSDVIIDWVRSALDKEYHVVGVTDGGDAAGVMVREQPAVILVDPGMASICEHAVRLTKVPHGSPQSLVVLFGSQPMVELANLAAEIGAHAFIEKSGDAHTFARRVGKLTTAETSEKSPPQQRKGDAKTILVAGRGWIDRAELLPRLGFSLVAVGSAKGVLDSLRTWKPALLVVGPNLPDSGAVELCGEVRKDPTLQRVSILFIGEAYDHARAHAARAAGANETLLRPLDEMTLFQTVGRLANVAARRKTRLLVRLEIKAGKDDAFTVGFSHNVSASGMLVETDQPLADEQLIHLRFFVPSFAEEIEVTAKVVRVLRPSTTGNLAGVHFVEIADRHRDAIDEFVTLQQA